MMKHLIVILLMTGLFAACKRTTTNGPQLQFEGEDTKSGIVTVNVAASGEEDKTWTAGVNILEHIASRRAFEQLLFLGVPNSVNFRVPLTPSMERSTDKNEFLKNFFTSREYRRFITDIHQTSSQRVANNYRQNIRFSVSINAVAFRKYLEQNGEIRAFGY